MSESLIKAWYQGAWWLWLLWPLSLLYRVLRQGLLVLSPPPKANLLPLLVVGNISLGGTGKTPVVQALVRHLAAQGIRCGIISRGYGGQVGAGPKLVTAKDTPLSVGDEPYLLWQTTQVPVVVGSDRQAAIKLLAVGHDLDLIISDDGLQNQTIKGDMEWLLIDGQRGLGNGQCLPMGPLREPPQRLNSVDAIMVVAGEADKLPKGVSGGTTPVFYITPKLTGLRRLYDNERVAWPAPNSQVKALAGIGNPQRFFADLEHQGLTVEPVAFADHHHFRAQDLAPFRDLALIMTAKDAVKCKALADSQDQQWYYAEQGLELPASAVQAVLNKLHLDGKYNDHG
ncbi:MAG: tetraacyldisaccharide 4'-kinase [Gammaproteobacteria bacterium]|nr:tetraacyldisaccharide 4'-kinase [Gammaproteobacteria bacterium]